MAQTINTNVASLNAQRNLNASQSSLGTTLQRLSSGLRINSAKDDAAGLAIAERMNTQVRGFNVAIRNASDGISLGQTAEGAIGKIGDSLQRMRELAVQSKNGTNKAEDRTALNTEYAELAAEVTRLVDGTTFNEQKLLDGSVTEFKFQVGAGNAAEDTITVKSSDLKGLKTAFAAGIDGADDSKAAAQITALDTALTTVATARSNYGAVQNRFESVVSNLQVSSENLSAARGRIMDADFATETANLSRTQILQQAGTAMLAQANSLPQNVLSLLR